MGGDGAGAGTVVGGMDTLEDTAEETDPGPETPRRRRLDRRTVALCVCVALVAAIAAGLLASMVVDDGDDGGGPSDGALQLVDQVDAREVFTTEVFTPDGEATTLEAYRTAQPMVLNLWQQSCVPCIDEMPLLEQAHQDNPDIDFVGAHILDPVAKAKVMAAETGITYPWVDDPAGEVFYATKAAGMPTTVAVLPTGEVVATKTGAFSSAAELQRWLDDHLG